MKWIALLLVLVGVAMASAIGARNTQDLVDRQQLETTKNHFNAERDKAHKAYCDAHKKAELVKSEECVEKENHWKTVVLKHETPEARQKAAQDTLASLQSSTVQYVKKQPESKDKSDAQAAQSAPVSEKTKAEITKARTAWISAFEASIEPASKTWAAWSPPAPWARLTAWFGTNGLPFAGGLVLIIIGGLLARKVARDEATAQPESAKAEEKAPIDFATLLRTLQEEAQALSDEMAASTTQAAPNVLSLSVEEADKIKARIEAMQLERVDRLIEAIMGLQVRYGLTAFAQVFDPMSAGERNLNRAWSAMVDSHVPEATTSIAVAASKFAEACEQMDIIRAQA